MAIDITSAGAVGVHSFKKVNVNTELNYIYFKDSDIPDTIVEGSSYIYSDVLGSVDGIDNQGLVYAFLETDQILKFNDGADPETANTLNFTGAVAGTIALNLPVIFDSTFNINIPTPTNQAVKYYTEGSPITGLVSGNTYFLNNVPADFSGTQALYEIAGNAHTFTTCGQTGRLGPTNSQILAGYSTSWHGQNLKQGAFQGYQDWTVPVSGLYEFDVLGASGFNGTGQGTVGRGARVRGRVELIKGEVVTIAVGQVGEAPESGFYGGSGGGTFVVQKSNNNPLFVAGGGSSKTNIDAENRNGKDGQLTNRGGLGAFNRPGGANGLGGSAQGGWSAGGGGFLGRGENSTSGEQGGGSFVDGLTSQDNLGRVGGNGGFGGAGSSDGTNSGQSGGAGGYSGGAGARTTIQNYSGGGGGSWITPSATLVATSNGTYEDSSSFNNVAITNLNSYNTGNGSVVMTLVNSFTSGNTIHPTAQDAEDGTNAIEIVANGNSYHSLVPISYDIQNDKIHFSSEHGFLNGQAISFSLATGTPDIVGSATYYVNRIDDFSIGLVYSPAVNFTVPTKRSSSDTIREIVVNLDLDTIFIPNHGFTVDQPIQYSTGSGEPIAPLQSNNPTYYVAEVLDANTIKIKNAINSPTPFDFTAAGTGTGHSFTFITVNTTENTLFIQNHGLVSGQLVKYQNNGGSSIGGLTSGADYFVQRIDNSTVKLFEDAARTSATNLTTTGTGSHSLVIASIDFTNETITLPGHGFDTGEIVEYDSRGQDVVSGLTSGQTYYAIRVDVDNIKLALSDEDAVNDIPINLASTPTGVGTHSLEAVNQTPDGIYSINTVPTGDTFTVQARGQIQNLSKTFNPRESANIDIEAFFIPSHGFLTGIKLSYSAGDGTSIGGLVTDTDYFAVVINQDYFRLASSKENADSGITLSTANFGTGDAHTFTTSQLNGRVVGSGNVSVDAGSVLVDGVGTSFSKILKVGDPFTLYPKNEEVVLTFGNDNVNIGANRIEKAHNFVTGDFVKFNQGTGLRPIPLTNNYYYYVEAVDASTLRIYTSLGAANIGAGFIDFSEAGTGTDFTLTKTSPLGPIIRRITAVGSDIQVTVDRPYSDAYAQVAYAYPTFVYVRPSGYALHRPFDGGVEMSTGAGNSFAQIIRQTRKYFRYQSGKGIQTSFAINFQPSVDIESMERLSPTTIECKTRRTHNLISGLMIRVAEAKDSLGQVSSIYNGDFDVVVNPEAVDGLTTFTITSAGTVPTGAESRAYGFPQFHVTSWTNGAIRSGMFDFQNGMFFEYDGQKIYAVRRSSTQQTSGTISALRGSELIFGEKTRFTAQLEEGDSIVLRGQTYKVIDIQDDTTLSVRPEYRGSTGLEITFDPSTQVNPSTDVFTVTRHGLSQNLPITYNSIDGNPIGGLINGRTYYADFIDANNFKIKASPDAETDVSISSVGTTNLHSFIPAKSGIIVTKTVDVKVPQEDWNVDVCDGTGPSGYNLDLSRIQMAYIDYSWYGAGKIRFGFKTDDGLVRYVHEFKHNNVLFESYLRSGNLPARYEVATGLNPTYIPSLFHWGTSVIMDGRFDDDRGYLFTAASQTLNISGTTTKSFASNGIDLTTDLITSLTHGFKTGQVVQFQSIAANGFPGSNNLNPSTQVVGSSTSPNLSNTERYRVFVNSPDRIHLTPENAVITAGATISRSGGTVTVVTATDHGIMDENNTGIYGLPSVENIPESYVGPVTIINGTSFTFPATGSFTVESTPAPNALISEVLNFTTQGNTQYTYFLYPDGSLNNTSGPNYQPLISIRLSPSADSGITGKLGDRDIINRMQLRMNEIGVSTDELVEVKLVLNGRLNNLGFTAMPNPSLVELVEHTPQDTISGGIQVYNFQAEGGTGGNKGTTSVNIDQLFELSNSILGGDNIFPDGPDILTVAVSRLTGNDTRTSAKLSWGEAQA